jgi:hypothetical protein
VEEKKFPIYGFSFRWHQDNYQNNASAFSQMFKEEPTREELEEVISKNVERINKEKNVTEWLEAKYHYKEHETWHSNWFNHMTYNDFETNEEVELSFSEYLDRIKLENNKNGHYGFEANYDLDHNITFRSVMGADDRDRWKICRCKDCKKMGKITIDH